MNLPKWSQSLSAPKFDPDGEEFESNPQIFDACHLGFFVLDMHFLARMKNFKGKVFYPFERLGIGMEFTIQLRVAVYALFVDGEWFVPLRKDGVWQWTN